MLILFLNIVKCVKWSWDTCQVFKDQIFFLRKKYFFPDIADGDAIIGKNFVSSIGESYFLKYALQYCITP